VRVKVVSRRQSFKKARNLGKSRVIVFQKSHLFEVWVLSGRQKGRSAGKSREEKRRGGIEGQKIRRGGGPITILI